MVYPIDMVPIPKLILIKKRKNNKNGIVVVYLPVILYT